MACDVNANMWYYILLYEITVLVQYIPAPATTIQLSCADFSSDVHLFLTCGWQLLKYINTVSGM